MSNYKLYPLEKEIIKDRLKNEKDLYEVFKKNKDITKIIDEDFKQKLHDKKRKNWVLIQINGETGTLKSSVGIAIAKTKLDENFEAKNVVQQYSQFEELLSKSKPKESFILDEMVFQRGIGSTRMRENIINLAETLRKRQNSMIFITPTEKFIDDDNVTITLEPCGIDEEKKIVRCLTKKNRYIGFYYIKLLWNEPIWIEYEKNKDYFTEMSSKQQYAKIDYEILASRLLQTINDEHLKKKRRIILHVEKNAPNMTVAERDLLIEQIIIFRDEGIPDRIKKILDSEK